MTNAPARPARSGVLAQVRDNLFLEFETGVIGADMNAHGILLKSSQTSNAH